MPADPDKGLHANRPYAVPTAGGVRNCFSRTDILEGRTPAAFGSSQSMETAVTGVDKDNPDTWTKNWYAQARYLRVPKSVILSSFPFWALHWPACYFYFPRDVIGETGYGGLGNYYYLEQWNALDPEASQEHAPDYSWTEGMGYDVFGNSLAGPGDDGYNNNRGWGDMRHLEEGDKGSVYNAKLGCQIGCQDEDCALCADIPEYLIKKCPTPPGRERYQKQVCHLQNPYYDIHKRLREAFGAAKDILENDPADPIYVNVPNWLPTPLRQVRNAYLKRTRELRNAGHGGSVNKRPCQVSDSIPCHHHVPECWAPPYPDIDDPRNSHGFRAPTVPWLLSANPGFGTNTLHLYVGHPNMAYLSGSRFDDYQAWPLTPEVQYLAGPVYMGAYLGDPRPYFAGRRSIWRAFGFNYGYAVHGPEGLYDSRYGPIIEGAANEYRKNFWKYRNFGTRLFTYDAKWEFNWDFETIRDDRRNDCPATQFYFGDKTFAEFSNEYRTDDNSISDCSSYHNDLKVGETKNYAPSASSIQQAINIGRALTGRVEEYYKKNDEGSAAFFQLALARNGMADFNCSYEGAFPEAMMDADGIVAYVREYFSEHP